MSARLKGLRRIHKLQSQIKRVAEARLATSERRKAELDTALRELGAFFERDGPIGDLAALGMRQAQRLARREAEAEQDRAGRATTLLHAESRLALMERRIDDLDRDDRRLEERLQLERILDAFANRADDPS